MKPTKTDEFPFSIQERKSRAYIHDACGTTTEISGLPFIELTLPDEFVLGTKCMKCGAVSLASVRWADTGESIADYRKRLKEGLDAQIPKLRELLMIIGLLIFFAMAIVGAVLNLATPPEKLFLMAYIPGCVLMFPIFMWGGYKVAIKIRSAALGKYLRKHKFAITHID